MGILLYRQEHLDCPNYDSSAIPLIETIKRRKGEKKEWKLKDNEIIFIKEGRLSISLDRRSHKGIPAGQMIFLPCECNCSISYEEETFLLVFRLRNRIQLCDRLGIMQLPKNKSEKDFFIIDANDMLFGFFSTMEAYLSDGLKCYYFLESKINELFILMRGYYEKEKLSGFFAPLLNGDTDFSLFVLRNHHKVKTVQQLAALSCYSYSAFTKRFRKAFGVSPYKWIKEQKSKQIFHQINTTDKPLKKICTEYGFSSLSQFNDYCKANFGLPPAKIRKKEILLKDAGKTDGHKQV